MISFLSSSQKIFPITNPTEMDFDFQILFAEKQNAFKVEPSSGMYKYFLFLTNFPFPMLIEEEIIEILGRHLYLHNVMSVIQCKSVKKLNSDYFQTSRFLIYKRMFCFVL